MSRLNEILTPWCQYQSKRAKIRAAAPRATWICTATSVRNWKLKSLRFVSSFEPACCVCVSRSDGQTKPVRLLPHHKTRQRTSLLKKSCLVARDFENGNAGVRGNKQREAMKLNNFIQNRGSWPVNGQAGKQPFFGDSKLLQKCPSANTAKKRRLSPQPIYPSLTFVGLSRMLGRAIVFGSLFGMPIRV